MPRPPLPPSQAPTSTDQSDAEEQRQKEEQQRRKERKRREGGQQELKNQGVGLSSPPGEQPQEKKQRQEVQQVANAKDAKVRAVAWLCPSAFPSVPL